MIRPVDDYPVDKMPESKDRKDQPLDIVQKAPHYNGHPSGVECIDLAELMTFNAGNAFKYVFRRGSKGNEAQDLEKALWYTKRELSRVSLLLQNVPIYILRKYGSNNTFTEADEAKANLVIERETDRTVRVIYAALLTRADIKTYRIHLQNVQSRIQDMIFNLNKDAK